MPLFTPTPNRRAGQVRPSTDLISVLYLAEYILFQSKNHKLL